MNKTMRIAVALTALTMMSVPAFAQAQAGGQRGQGGGQRGQGGGQGGFGQRPGGAGPFSLATAPVKALTAALKLNEDQAAKITAVQEKHRQMMQELRQAGGGGGGGAPDPAAQAEMRAKTTEMNKKAAAEIEKILTPDQAAMVKSNMRLWTVVSGMGFSIEIADSLKLTDEQLTIMEKAIKDRAAQQQGGARRGGGN